MTEQIQINKIKEAAREFFDKIMVKTSSIEANISKNPAEEGREIVNLSVQSDEPQILIGQGGQTLLEIQRLLKTILNKKFQQVFYLNLDINDYKAKKAEYLGDMAKNLADQAVSAKEEKVLPPMSAYERRIVHAELSQRNDVTTESRGEGFNRHIVIIPK